jgi:transcriptional regulator with XRE-family HTH domain
VAAGQQLKLLRNRRNITVRGVEQASRRIADAKRDKRYRISNGWLTQLENGVSDPNNIRKLFSLCVIYRVELSDLLSFYDIDVDKREHYESVANPQRTQLLPAGSIAAGPCEFDRPITRTCLASELATQHTASLIPVPCNGNSSIIQGYLGLNDLTMYPLIRPGSLLQIDTSQNKLQMAVRTNEYDRPIYFVELRDGYACGWCELQGNKLLIIPHQSSGVRVRAFTYPREAEIVGRVVAYYTRCVDLSRAEVPGDKGATD